MGRRDALDQPLWWRSAWGEFSETGLFQSEKGIWLEAALPCRRGDGCDGGMVEEVACRSGYARGDGWADPGVCGSVWRKTDRCRRLHERCVWQQADLIRLRQRTVAKAGGETEKQIYRFTKGESDISLRFDLTVPLAKYVAEYYHELSFPFRRYQIGKVYRGEKPQKGRFREFYQCDIDIIGDGELDLINDAEIPSIIYTLFRELGFEDFTIKINNRKILNGLFEGVNQKENATEILRIIDKIEKIGKEAVIEELEKIEVSKDSIKKIIDFIEIEGTSEEKIEKLKKLEIKNETFITGVNELEFVIKNMGTFGIPKENYKVDLTIARGLDYYTGTVYETFLNEYRELGSVCSGGRYENLAEYYTDKKLPGVGVSIGLTRLFYKLNELNLIKAKKKSISDVLIIPMIEDLTVPIEIASELRKSDIKTEIYLNNKKLKAKFKYADKLEIPYVVVIGEDEIEENKYKLKDMKTGNEQLVDISQMIKILKQ